LLSLFVDLLHDFALLVVLGGDFGLAFEKHLADQDLAVAQFADAASRPLAVLVDLHVEEGPFLAEALLAHGAAAEVAPLDVLLFLKGDHLARGAVSRLGFLLVGAFQLEDDRGSGLVDLVVRGPELEDAGLLGVLLDHHLLHLDFVLELHVRVGVQQGPVLGRQQVIKGNRRLL